MFEWFDESVINVSQTDDHNLREKNSQILFLLAIVLFVLLRYADSNYHFGIFKLFFNNFRNSYKHLKKKYFDQFVKFNTIFDVLQLNCTELK
jgi:hypothetical protein